LGGRGPSIGRRLRRLGRRYAPQHSWNLHNGDHDLRRLVRGRRHVGPADQSTNLRARGRLRLSVT